MFNNQILGAYIWNSNSLITTRGWQAPVFQTGKTDHTGYLTIVPDVKVG